MSPPPRRSRGSRTNLECNNAVDALVHDRDGEQPQDPPPTIPAQMCVLVADMVVQSGSTITGDVIGAVLVNTDPGYEGDPGHPGTGMIVADPTGICSSGGPSF